MKLALPVAVLLTVVLTGPLTFFASCKVGKKMPVTRSNEPAPTLTQLANQVGLTFPQSARLIAVHRESGIDDMVSFKVEMAPTDLPAFMAASPVSADAFSPGEGGLLGPDNGPWDPNRAAKLRTGQVIRTNHRALNIGIDDGKAGAVFLYIVDHGT